MFILFFFLLANATLEGTWVSHSRAVVTGPSFFDPVSELLVEPALPGLSYSFDADGNWESAVYQVTPNPVNHSCPTAVLLWQHGKYTSKYDKKLGKTKLELVPHPVDGRQLLSDPCHDHGVSTYARYHQPETMSNYVVEPDHYTGRLKLTLYEWDGKKKQPLWLEYRPPTMLPTEVLNPTKKHPLKHLKRSLMNSTRTTASHWLGGVMLAVGAATMLLLSLATFGISRRIMNK